MAILKNVWRIICDPNGQDDPDVQVYLKKTVTVDGETVVKFDENPVHVKLSDFVTSADFTDVDHILTRAAEHKAARIAAAKLEAEQRMAKAEA